MRETMNGETSKASVEKNAEMDESTTVGEM